MIATGISGSGSSSDVERSLTAWSGTLTRHGAPAAHIADHGDGTRQVLGPPPVRYKGLVSPEGESATWGETPKHSR